MTKIVGVVNVTPNSFSNLRHHLEPQDAIAHAHSKLVAGADVIDVGAESTRPNAKPLESSEVWSRLESCLPEIVRMARLHNAEVSVDTHHPDVAARAVALGVDWINDVGGTGPEMAKVVAGTGATLVCMHSLTVPVVPSVTMASIADVVAHMKGWFAERLETLSAAGVDPSRVIFDPGIGFGTTERQAFELIGRMPELQACGTPILVGHSRKSFMTTVTAAKAPYRDDVTLALSGVLIAQNVDYIRVHNVERHVGLRARLAARPRSPA